MSISVSSISKSFGPHRALSNVSLSIETGTFFIVLGPSGCGKSTLLRSIAGLEPIDAGRIALGGSDVAFDGFHMAPEHRRVGVVFQSYALWPHMSVAGNVAFPLETAGHNRSNVSSRVSDCLETVSLTAFAGRKPAELSGGQRQRVALARCLAQGAETVLMDEPLANLDPHLRGVMEEELSAFHKASGATTLFITHDQREAMALADKVAVMWDGEILQVDEPDAIYRRPNSRRVAGFIGRSSLVPVRVDQVSGEQAKVSLGRCSISSDCAAGTNAGHATLLIRPEHLVPDAEHPDLEGTVVRTVYRGGAWDVFVAVDGIEAPLLLTLHRKADTGDVLRLAVTRSWVIPGQNP
ncbi:ABC transporter ATP-binding protein [Roseibium sp.]|uniref:ABC transporter ATP-binding protein n=1 Tax=Roseibium sp. TaxID=1936156 RepID=UPI003B514ADD